MDLDQFLVELQSAYLAEFVAVYSAELQSGDNIGSEIALEVASGVYRNLYVADFVVQQNGSPSIIELAPTDGTVFGPAEFEERDFTVHFDAVSWDAMMFKLPDGVLLDDALEPWFVRWLDVNREPESGAITTGIIHSVVIDGDAISVDFGTAPAIAAKELLALIRDHGVQTVQVTSSRY